MVSVKIYHLLLIDLSLVYMDGGDDYIGEKFCTMVTILPYCAYVLMISFTYMSHYKLL